MARVKCPISRPQEPLDQFSPMSFPPNPPESFCNELIRLPHLPNGIVKSPNLDIILILIPLFRFSTRRVEGYLPIAFIVAKIRLEQEMFEKRHVIKSLCERCEERIQRLRVTMLAKCRVRLCVCSDKVPITRWCYHMEVDA